MSVPSIDERRDACSRLRAAYSPTWGKLAGCVFAGAVRHTRTDICQRLADLMDPTPWQNTVEDNERLIERCRRLEVENARLKAHVRALELIG